MMVLGIGESYHDNGIVLLENGRIVAAINEERLSRRKFDNDIDGSLGYIFDRLQIDPKKLDAIAVAGLPPSLLVERLLENEKANLLAGYSNHRVDRFFITLMRKSWLVRLKHLLAKFGVPSLPLHFVDHHTAHAVCAYVGSGRESMLVFTCDGWGDGYSGGCFEASRGSVKPLHLIPNTGSAGSFYVAVTSMLGFNNLRHQGKITGLAAYGKQSAAVDVVRQSFRLVDGVPRVDLRRILLHGRGRSGWRLVSRATLSMLSFDLQKIWRFFSDHILTNNSLYFTENFRKELASFTREDIAYAFQLVLEEVVAGYVGYYLKRFGPAHVGFSGGVFANVKLNQQCAKLEGVESLYVYPHMGDGGLAAGAAFHFWLESLRKKGQPYKPNFLTSVFLGWAPRPGEIEQALSKYTGSVVWQRHETNLEEIIAKRLAQNLVIGRYSGPMEYGPRSLGNRSILYHASDPNVNNWLNQRLNRTEFMPFAPSTLWEQRHLCYRMDDRDWSAAEFMTIVFECTDWMRQSCPAAVHVDGTARPQLVRMEHNPTFHKILTHYFRETGFPTVVNTSFNMHEEPIVCTPEDALRALLKGGCDVLFLEEYECHVCSPSEPQPAV
ncbi:MAG: carbamoyltransferase [Magnetococcales bacterium]|nr:carbamoyltransferase [Magnetococcales bacterium]